MLTEAEFNFWLSHNSDATCSTLTGDNSLHEMWYLGENTYLMRIHNGSEVSYRLERF